MGLKYITYEGELKKNPELKESDIQMLREWCEKQPHLPKVSDTDLVLFLHSNYYKMEATKTNIETYFTLRTHLPEFFTNRDLKKSPELYTALNVAFTTPIEGKTNEGYGVLYWKIVDYDVSKYVHVHTMKLHVMMFDLWLQTYGTMKGHVLVVDTKGIGVGHVTRTSPIIFKKFLCYLQDAFPVRLKAIHFLNSMTAVDMLFTMCKPFMRKELIEMLHFHTTMETFEKIFPLEILPNESGGKAGPVEEFRQKSIKDLEEFRDWFAQDELHGRVNESLRVGKAKNATDLFGAEGSFKSLAIDLTFIKIMTAEEEFKKNPELKESDLELLREWCKKQPHLPKIADIDLILFLHSNYYLLEPTKKTIDNYYTMRTHVPEFFTNRDFHYCESLRKQLDIAVYMPLKGLSKNDYNIIYSRLIDFEPSHFVHSETEKGYNMVLDMWLRTEGTVKGHVILIDMHGTQLGHVSRMNPSVAKKSLLYLQDALPVRLKEIHVMNASPIFDLMLTICKPFMKKELLDMLHIHTTKESLENFIPLEILPNEAGGKAGPLSKFYEERMKLLTEFRDWFTVDEANGRVNENLRPGKSKNAGEIFGVEGSFKKLDID
ncbi:uncharacterized protein LOC127286762 [Leptopilina boulardi]|uniref:uncharacterized protein LOC127286762 n=1 Tax=Leptopilina boulardi TaxID=63433 RepID=UPI0021F67544|nr:uncharacterized protein LOC127286762 [Leptopilina boulardi]